MIIDFNKQKNSLYLIIFYIIVIILAAVSLKHQGIHIEEKFHRLNGLYWLNYIANTFNLVNLQEVTHIKISKIYDYTLSPIEIYNKYGIVLDLPAAVLEVFFKIEKVKDVYYLKHLLSFFIFLLSSIFFFKILIERYNNFLFSYLGLILYVTTPRIFGDSFLYKDVLFLSIFMMMIYFFLRSVEKLNYKNLLFFSFFTALSINLRIFAVIIPFLFLFIIIIKNFYLKNLKNNYKEIIYYFFLLLIFIYIFWPYLWENPLENFLNLFKSLNRDLIDVKIFYYNSYISNKTLPTSYILNWIFISSPLFYSFLFTIGYFLCFYRLCKRYISIKKYSFYHDLWRGDKEEKDFIFLFLLTIFFVFFMFFNAPFYNGWRLVYFFNIFIIYFSINLLFKLNIYFIKKKYNYIFIFFIVYLVFYNIYSIIKMHPYQSIYFNSFISKKMKNSFEGDYYGLGSKHFFNHMIKIEKKRKINIAIASHTPIQRGLEALSETKRSRFNIVGQEYNKADYIFKNNISEVNSNIIKKYQIPKNFSKIYDLKINEIVIYEIYKRSILN
jgi:hypothetical protein